jgi:hypothetical protein
VNNI